MNRYVPNVLIVIFFTLVSLTGFSQAAGDFRSNLSITTVGTPTTTTTATINLPSGLQEGDIVFVITYSDNSTPNTPTGYTAGQSGSSNSTGYQWSYKIMGTTPDATATGLSTGGAGVGQASMAFAFRNVDPTTPLDVSSPAIGTGGTLDPDPPSITTVSGGSVVLALGYLDDDAVGGYTEPTGYTFIGNSSTTGGVMAAYLSQTTAGASNPGVFPGPGDDGWVGATVALRIKSGNWSNPDTWQQYFTYSNITLVGTATSSTSATITLPSGLQEGDLVIVAGSSDNTTVNTPTGYTSEQTNGAGGGGGASIRYNWTYKFMGSTPDATASGLTTGNGTVYIAFAFRNVDPTNPFQPASPGVAGGGTGNPDPPSITPSNNNSMVVALGFLDDDAVAGTSTAPTTPSTFTLITDAQSTTGGTSSIMAAYFLQSTAAAINPGAFGSSGDDTWASATIALAKKPNGYYSTTIYPGQNSGTGVVTVQNTHTVILDVSPANAIGSLVLGSGVSGSLVLGNSTTARTLNITGGITVNTGGSVTVANNTVSHQFNVGGSISNGGTFDLNLDADSKCNITFNGSGTQNLGGTNASDLNNVTVSNTGGGNVTIVTNPTLNGDLSVTSGTLNNGGFAVTLASAKNLSVSNGATLNLTGTSTMVAVSGGGTKTFQTTSTVNYAGANQTVTAETYGHLIFSGSGTKTLPAATTTVVGNFTTNGTAATTAAGNPLNVNGNVTLNSSGAFNAGTATHEVWGSWYKNSATAFTPSTSTIIFTNTSNAFETVGGTQDNTFYNASIDGTTLSLGSNMTVSNTLTLNSKLLYLNNFNTTLSSASGLNWTGGGDSYVVTNGSGRFIRTIGASGTYNFPLGDFVAGGSIIGTDNTLFNPAVMTWSAAPGVTSVSSHFSNAALGAPSGLTANIYGGPDATPITSFLNNGYWDFTAVGTTSNYDLTLTTDGVTNMGSLAEMHAIFRNTSTGASVWGLGGGSASPVDVWPGGPNSTAGFGGVISPQTKNVSQFGYFGIGRSDNAYVLPIVLVAFDGTNVGNANVLSWSTASEINNDFFTIERSLDGQNYEDIGIVEGAGQSSQVLNYTFTDDQPFLGTNYYRLKQTDYNGQFDYSPVISLKVNSSFEMGYPYPNPVLNKVNMNINSTASGLSSITIYDMAGREMYNNIITVNEGIQTIGIDMSNFASGMYISEIMVDGVPYRNTILKQ